MTENTSREFGRGDAKSSVDRTAAAELTATPTEALVDRPLEITLTGLQAGQRATVSAAFSDLETRWRCAATFEADADGVVDLTEQTPVEGDYADVRPMGLVQLATEAETARVEGATDSAEVGGSATDDGEEYQLRLTAAVDGERIAETTVTRRACAPGVERVELDPETDGIAGEYFVPPGDGQHPGVVALHGSGGSPEVRFAKLLASHGYATVALRYFGEPEPIPDRLAEVPVSSVGRAIEWLRDHDRVSGGDVGVLGTSRGTELAFLTAGLRDDVGAVVAYAPSAYVWPGEGMEDEDPESDGPGDATPPAWTLDGEPLRPIPHPEGEEATPARTERGIRPRSIFEELAERASDDEREAAALPVDGVEANVLLVSGADDGVWHADEMAETLTERLREESSAGEVTHVCHENTGHHAAAPYLPTAGRTVAEIDDGPNVVNGGTPGGIADAEVRAWEEALDTFDDALRERARSTDD